MTKVQGKVFGLRAAEIGALEKLLHRRVPPARALSYELARELSGLADALGRSVGVTLDRRGRVRGVWVDAPGRVLPAGLDPPRTGPSRFSGLRFVYATASQGGVTHVDATEAVRLRMDAWVRVESTGKGSPRRLWILLPDPLALAKAGEKGTLEGVRVQGSLDPHGIPADFLETIQALEEELERTLRDGRPAGAGERALLAGLCPWTERKSGLASLDELDLLARSALMEVVGKDLQTRDKPDSRTWLGKGFVEELVHQAARLGATVVVADTALTPVQARNLSEAVGLPVVDRVGLILKIFERRARSKDAKMRVELARLRYELSRLRGTGKALSQIGGTSGGGVGVRGKGEPRLEMDRRRLRERIQKLSRRIRERGAQRKETRKARLRSGLPIVSLVGYTNAGKTTLLCGLTGAKAFAEDLLFATLDPLARRLRFPGSKRKAILTDTVGFLRELPEGLLDAFRATLEELREADLLVHVIDLSSEDFEKQKEAVEETLAWLGLEDLPRLDVYNKADLVDRRGLRPVVENRGGLMISALDPRDLETLAGRIERSLEETGAWARKRSKPLKGSESKENP